MTSIVKDMDGFAKTFADVCVRCKDSRVFAVVKHEATFSLEFAGDWIFILATCTRCTAVALYEAQDLGETLIDIDLYRVYPNDPRQIEFELPKGVRRAYEEAVKSEIAGAWLACGVMIGRTLEEIAKEYDARANLSIALKKMHLAGVISAEVYEWSNHIRFIRNSSAHADATEPTEEDIREGLDFTQAILEILYDLRPRFERLKTRHRAQANV